MCNYRYEFQKHHLTGMQCIYPQFYQNFFSFFSLHTQELPIDKDGWCLFHSKDENWKSQNQIKERFLELLRVTAKVCKSVHSFKWPYNFSGFLLGGESYLLNAKNCPENSALDFRFCKFSTKFSIKDINLKSIDFAGSTFLELLEFENVKLNSGVNSSNAIFENGIKLYDTQLQGYSYFDNCTFRNTTHKTSNNFSFNKVISEELYFEKSTFDAFVTFQNSIFKSDLILDKARFMNEFYFHDNEISGLTSFKEAKFTFPENTNPMYCSVDFKGLNVQDNAKVIFKGLAPFENMVSGELRINFATEPKGLVSFENFNLNKITLDAKLKLFELEKNGKVEIGSGCRKYYCQSDIFSIISRRPDQRLILDLINVFCKYFESQNSYNLGIEIVERKEDIIRYFFFTDEIISKQEFEERIKQNEYDLWQSFSNLSTAASNQLQAKYAVEQDLLLEVAFIFLKIKNRIILMNKNDDALLRKIVTAISIDHISPLEIKKLIPEIQSSSKSFYRELPALHFAPQINNDNSMHVAATTVMISTGNHTRQSAVIKNHKEDLESSDLARSSLKWTKTQTIWTIIGVILATILAIIGLQSL